MLIPSLPFEIAEKIILIAVADLVDHERTHPSPLASPLVNAFLLSTSLVSSTWRSISQPALLRNGLVGPSGAEDFLCQPSGHRMVFLARSVRIWGGRDPGAGQIREEAPLLVLLSVLRRVEKVEIVGRVRLPQIQDRGPDHLILTNQSHLGVREILRKVQFCPPFRLTIIESINPQSLVMFRAAAPLLTPIFEEVHHFDITSSSSHLGTFALFLMGFPTLQSTPFPLQTCRLAASDPAELAAFPRRKWSNTTLLPHLTHLTTHLRILDFSPSDGATLPPHLTSVEVLPNPMPERYRELDPQLDEEAEGILLSVVNELAKLESFVVPECWRSAAVAKLCEARGITIVWTT